MDPTLVSAFAQFGYPALVSGILLYILINKLEKVTMKLEEVDKAMLLVNESLKECRGEVREAAEQQHEYMDSHK